MDRKIFNTNNYNFKKSVIKPNKQGSSVGFSIVDNQDKIVSALDFALNYDSHALVEEYIEGNEITVSV
ncbi:hypothetical protein OAQ61_04070, partial [Candidatus Marinimicrobia bacterium]|nr:hypothetical protein [Candidatus Neomarinimicrobiota bacterium]